MQPGSSEEQRRHRRQRYRCDVQVSVLATGWLATGKLEDLSFAGCYIATLVPPEQGTRIQVRFPMETEEFEALAVVRFARPGLGMGIEFTQLEDHMRQRLAAFLKQRQPGARRRAKSEQDKLGFEAQDPAEK
ncbi:MAG: PilZ domain-containing protein [Terriglobia bacterium]